MKGLRGRENTGETENIRATVSGEGYPVARFTDVFSGEVQVRPRKDGNGYDAMEFDMRVVQPALHRKDENVLGKAIINIFEKVPVITPGQPHSSEQTVSLAKDAKDGSALAHIKLTFQIKGDAPEEQPAPAAAAEPEAEQPTSPSAPAPEPEASHLIVKNPPASPAKESESGSTATSESKDETTSKKTHRHRRSSNSSAMAAIALKKKEEEMKQKEAEFEEEKKALNEKIEAQKTEIDELKNANQHLEKRVKELEQASEQTDVVPADPAQEKMQDDLRRLTAQNEVLQEQKAALTDEKDGYAKKIVELNEALEEANKKLEEMKNQPATASSDENKDQELALLKEQLAALKAELGKKDEAAPPAKSNMVMQAIIGAAGAVLGIILGKLI